MYFKWPSSRIFGFCDSFPLRDGPIPHSNHPLLQLDQALGLKPGKVEHLPSRFQGFALDGCMERRHCGTVDFEPGPLPAWMPHFPSLNLRLFLHKVGWTTISISELVGSRTFLGSFHVSYVERLICISSDLVAVRSRDEHSYVCYRSLPINYR